MKKDTEMSSNARNVGSKFLRGEGICSAHGSPPTLRWVTLGWREVIYGLELYKASPARWEVTIVGDGV